MASKISEDYWQPPAHLLGFGRCPKPLCKAAEERIVTDPNQPNRPASANEPPASRQQSPAEQIVAPHLVRRNQICFAIIVSLLYLTAAVLYGDIVQAAICDKLGASNKVANLPSSLYLAFFTSTPILLTWLLPYMRMVRRVIIVAYLSVAAMNVLVALVLISPVSAGIKIALVVIDTAVIGGALSTAGVFGWEILSKGMTEVDRGKVFSITYGFGPGFAVLGSVGAQAVLGEKLSWLTFPYDCALLYGLTVPILCTMAFLARWYYVPIPRQPEQRQPFVPFIFGGMWDFIRQRQFLLLVIAYVLFNAAWHVFANASLNIWEAMGVEPKSLAGWVQVLRFGGKGAAGFLLGWLVARRGAKAGAVVTTLLTVAGLFWLLGITGKAYMVTFALFGAGELGGLYYPNYCVSASRPQYVKRNVSLISLFMLPAAAVPVMHGAISDHWSFHAGFWVALATGVAALVLVLALPHRRPAQAPALAEDQLPEAQAVTRKKDE